VGEYASLLKVVVNTRGLTIDHNSSWCAMGEFNWLHAILAVHDEHARRALDLEYKVGASEMCK